MKKIPALILAAVLTLSLMGCGSSKGSITKNSNVPYNSIAVDTDLVDGEREVFLKYYDVEFSVKNYEALDEYTAKATLLVTVTPKLPNPADPGVYQLDMSELSMYLPKGALGAGWDEVDIKRFSDGNGGNCFATKDIKLDYGSAMYVKEELSESELSAIASKGRSKFHVGYEFVVHFE